MFLPSFSFEHNIIEFPYCDLFCRSFDDGFPNLFINNAQEIRGQHVAFLACFSSPAVIFEQLSVIFALPRLFVASFTLVLPFFPTGSFERMEEEGDVATAFTMARILSNIPVSRGGPTSLVIYDIHALQVCFCFLINIASIQAHYVCNLYIMVSNSIYICRKDFTLGIMFCLVLKLGCPF